MISVCLPTRGRPESFKKMCTSMLETADNPNDLEFVSYHDLDDPAVYEYVGNHKEVIGERLYNYSQMWNECAKIATGDLYLYQADDIQFQTKGWDTKVKEAFNEYPDKILFVFFNDQRHPSSQACIYCVHKNWIDAVGYLTPPFFSSHLPDNWVNNVAKGVNRRKYLEDVLIRHIYIDTDQTHKDYVKRHTDDPPWDIFWEKRHERQRDIQKLLDYIEENK